MNDDYEISVRSRGGSGKSAKHAWSVYAPGGEEIAKGVESGSSRHAQTAAEKAQNEHYRVPPNKGTKSTTRILTLI